jgi:iron(III) transport system substrate-binding protein
MLVFLNGINRVPFLCLSLVFLALFSEVFGAEKPVYAKPQGWDKLVEAARHEGSVVVYIPPGFDRRGQLIVEKAFSESFPGINVTTILTSANEVVHRILSERRAGRYIPDVLIGGATPPVISLKPAGALKPLRPNLVLPEILDESAWLNNRLWWADNARDPFSTLSFAGYVQHVGGVNTKMANPQDFRSFWDVLNPKWKGKIVSHDIRRGGSGAFMVRFIYKNPQLGPSYLERLYSEMDITFTSDVRQTVDFLGAGRFAIGLFVGPWLPQAQEQGLPVALIPGGQLKEGASVAPSAGNVSIMDRAPHPNTAKLFTNWLLSREGQLAYQKSSGLPSLRIDIPKTGLYPFDVPQPNVSYVAAGAEEYTRIGQEVIPEIVNKALAKAGRRLPGR